MLTFGIEISTSDVGPRRPQNQLVPLMYLDLFACRLNTFRNVGQMLSVTVYRETTNPTDLRFWSFAVMNIVSRHTWS